MGDYIKAYYDANGALSKRVIVINEPNYDHTIHDNLPGEEGWHGVVIDKKTYDSFQPPLNVDGIAVHQDMNKWVAAKIALSRPALSAKLSANAAMLDAKIAADLQAEVALAP